jgi:hypothetical protein
VYSAFALALHALIAWFAGRLAALQPQQDRERYGASSSPSQQPAV